MLKVMIVCEKYIKPLDPTCKIITGADHALAGSLISSGLAETTVCYWDDYFHSNGRDAAEFVIEWCDNEKPDVLVISCLIRNIFDVDRVINKVSVPIVYIWWDHLSPHNRSLAELFSPLLALNVVMDGTDEFTSKYPEKYMQGWNSHDTRLFFDKGSNRDINVSFLGSTHFPFTDRIMYLDYLDNNGIEILVRSGLHGDNPVSIDKFAEIYQHTKIALNFTLAPYLNGHQLKGRTFEVTRCGAMLLESVNQHTCRYLTPFVEYVPWTDEKDLLKKILYYLEHDSERDKIAKAGCKKVAEKFSNISFWSQIFSIIGV